MTAKRPQKILLVEDELDLVPAVALTLEREGFVVVHVETGGAALATLRSEGADLVLLDRRLPDMPGTEVCRNIRADASLRALPVIMVTALGDDIDRIVGFEVGADDYLTKPYHLRELVLRIRAVLRRGEPAVGVAAPDRVEVGRVVLDVPGWRAFVDGSEVHLTPIEFKLLHTLLAAAGALVGRRELVRNAWGAGHRISEAGVDTHIRRLRAKLGPAQACLATVRKLGFRWDEDGGA